MITSIDSADTLGPQQVSKSYQWHLQAHKKIFAHSELKHAKFLKAFFDAKHAIFDENSSKTWKIDYPWTFARIKIFWDVVWSRQTPCWIANDLRNILQTYLVVKRCVKRTETALLCETWFLKFIKNGNFYIKIPWKWLWEALKTKKSPPPHVW